METSENMLFEAATHGDMNSLNKLLQEDPIILDRILVNSFGDTPVHIAAILGHTDFVKEILKRRPEFAQELNLQRSSPLHLAAAKGYTETVAALLLVNPQMSFARDRNGLAPIHLAAIKSRIDVLKGLIRAKPNATRLTVDRGQTILHLCIKYYQLEALTILMETLQDREFLNFKDSDGNTILHLAVIDKQVKIVEFLLKISEIEVNARNLSGMTPMDILVQSRRDERDEEIEKSLNRAGAIVSIQNNNQNVENPCSIRHDIWLAKTRKSLMVVASLIATMAFQAGVNPPGGVWQDTTRDLTNRDNKFHKAGYSILADNDPITYEKFLFSNTTAFVASLSIILLLISGLPMKKKCIVWILMVITWIAISAVAVTYIEAISGVTPERERKKPSVILVMVFIILIWPVLMKDLLLIANTIRLVIRIIRKLLNPRRRNPPPTIIVTLASA